MKTLHRHRRSLLATFVFTLILGLGASGFLLTPTPVAADCSGFTVCLPGDYTCWDSGCCWRQYCDSNCEFSGPYYYSC